MSSRSSIDLVREFHTAFNRPVRDLPDVGTPEERVLRVRLMLEEVLEFAKAANVYVTAIRKDPDYEKMIHLDGGIHNLSVWCHTADDHPDLAQMAHELADVEYVVNGTAVQLGIPLSACVAEIHAANMRKLSPDRKPIVDAHGKVRKPEGWKPADVAQVLAQAMRGEQTAECETCPDRGDFETLCCKGSIGATVTDPDGLLQVDEPTIILDQPCPNVPGSNYRSPRSGLNTACENCGADEYLHRRPDAE